MANAELGIASFNLWRGNAPSRVTDDIQWLMGLKDDRELDLIVCQEGANWYGLLSDLAHEDPNWAMIYDTPLPRWQKQNVVLFRPRTLMYDTHRYIDLREANDTLPDRGILRARFEVRNCQRDLVLFATHMHSHVENRAWWDLPRHKDYRRHVRRLTSMVGQTIDSRACVAVADWNVNLKSKASSAVPWFPNKAFQRAGMRSNWAALGFAPEPTHGKRYIDAVFAESHAVRFVSHRTVKMSSDHRALLTKVVIRDA